ncbi:hypothetical protein GCM10010256_01350 [Streptomyces coeruleorubidus]|nr:hypothetical protein GCM10010256_01350 [Streptomyces coeruleorubidus]
MKRFAVPRIRAWAMRSISGAASSAVRVRAVGEQLGPLARSARALQDIAADGELIEDFRELGHGQAFVVCAVVLGGSCAVVGDLPLGPVGLVRDLLCRVVHGGLSFHGAVLSRGQPLRAHDVIEMRKTRSDLTGAMRSEAAGQSLLRVRP